MACLYGQIVVTWRIRRLGRKPVIKFGDPILNGVYGDNDEDCLSIRAPQEYIREGADLESLAQTHRVGKDAAKSWRNRILF